MEKKDFEHFLNTEGFGLVLCSQKPSIAFSEKNGAKAGLQKFMSDSRIELYSMSAWGHYDYIGVVYSKSTDNILKLSRISPGIGPGITNFKVILGSLLYSQASFKKNLSQFDLPIKAICSIKCNKNFVAHPYNEKGKRENVWDFYNDFVNICKTEIQRIKQLTKSKVLFQIIAPFSWKDFILFIQSDSIDDIKKIIVKLRRYTFENPKPGKRHLIFHTHTIIGVPYLVGHKEINLISKNVKKEKINWQINLRIRPGHSSQIVRDLKQLKSDQKIKVNWPFGEFDLSIIPKESTELRNFILWYYQFFSPLAAKNSSSLLASLTNFYLDFDQEEAYRSSNKTKSPFLFREKSLEIYDKAKDYFPNHILSALISVSSSLDFFVNQHETIKSEFSIVSHSYNHFLKYFENSIIPEAKQYKGEDFWVEIVGKTWEIIYEFSYILSERFREGSLFGNINFEMPSVTYSGSFQKNLQAIESFVMKLSFNAGRQIQKLSYDKPISEYRPLNLVTCCVANSESPSNSVIINNAFIRLPLDALVFQENWFYIIHETGHIVYDELEKHLHEVNEELHFKLKNADILVSDWLEELFADAFTIKILFNMNYRDYQIIFFEHFCKNLLNWNIPKYHIKQRILFLEAWVKSKRKKQITVGTDSIEEIAKLGCQNQNLEKNNYKTVFDEFSELINEEEILKWYKAIHSMNVNYFPTKIKNQLRLISEISKYAISYYDKNNNKKDNELENKIKKLRRRITHELWFDSVTEEYL